MSVTQVFTVQPHVLGGTVVSIEADLSRGLHSFSIVGLAGKAIEEAKDRVSTAIKHSGFDSPKSQNHKIVISLAPADLKKEGAAFDFRRRQVERAVVFAAVDFHKLPARVPACAHFADEFEWRGDAEFLPEFARCGRVVVVARIHVTGGAAVPSAWVGIFPA